MDEKTKQKTLIFFLIVVIILVICWGVFAYLDIKTKKEIAAFQGQVATLQNQKEILQEEIGKLENQLQDLEEGKKPGSKTTTCVSTLTTADKTDIASWKTITNSKYSFSFQYPETWKILTNKNDLIELKDDESNINFKFLIGTEGVDIDETYKEESKKSIKVACENATKTNFSAGDNRLITVTFKKDNTSYAIILGYKYIGASLSSDIVEAFDLILKTVEFE